MELWPGLSLKGMPHGLDKRRVQAEINPTPEDGGRWIARCPSPFCSGAELVDPTDPRFFCITCENVLTKGDWIGVTFPRDWEAIEAELSLRAFKQTQAWVPGETVEDLIQQREALEKIMRAF